MLCEPQTDFFELSPGDMMLLCSDGLYSEINIEQIKNILGSKKKIKKKIDLFINTANDAGGRDNISAIAIEY